jgi:hypothetical protein
MSGMNNQFSLTSAVPLTGVASKTKILLSVNPGSIEKEVVHAPWK